MQFYLETQHKFMYMCTQVGISGIIMQRNSSEPWPVRFTPFITALFSEEQSESNACIILYIGFCKILQPAGPLNQGARSYINN